MGRPSFSLENDEKNFKETLAKGKGSFRIQKNLSSLFKFI